MGYHAGTRKTMNMSEELWDEFQEVKHALIAELGIPDMENLTFLKYMLQNTKDRLGLTEYTRYANIRQARIERENERTRRKQPENITETTLLNPKYYENPENIPIIFSLT